MAPASTVAKPATPAATAAVTPTRRSEPTMRRGITWGLLSVFSWSGSSGGVPGDRENSGRAGAGPPPRNRKGSARNRGSGQGGGGCLAQFPCQRRLGTLVCAHDHDARATEGQRGREFPARAHPGGGPSQRLRDAHEVPAVRRPEHPPVVPRVPVLPRFQLGEDATAVVVRDDDGEVGHVLPFTEE